MIFGLNSLEDFTWTATWFQLSDWELQFGFLIDSLQRHFFSWYLSLVVDSYFQFRIHVRRSVKGQILWRTLDIYVLYVGHNDGR